MSKKWSPLLTNWPLSTITQSPAGAGALITPVACDKGHRKGTGFPQRRAEAGFTLAELMVVVSLIAILSTISITTYISYNKSSAHRGAARETVAVLRNAQVRAVTEAATTECRFPTASRLEIHRSSGLVRTYELPANLQYVVSGLSNGKLHGFTHPGEVPGSNTHTNCFFYAKGTATPGLIGVKRIDTGKELYVEVTGLTARVTYCADPTPADPCPV